MPPASGGTTTTTPGHSEPCARWTVMAHPCRRSDIAFPVTVTGPEVKETSSEPSPVLVTVPTSPLAKPVGSSAGGVAGGHDPVAGVEAPDRSVTGVEHGLQRLVELDGAGRPS